MQKQTLNELTKTFILEFERQVGYGKQCTNKELVEKFINSKFYNNDFDIYYQTAVSKAIWWAVVRSGSWILLKKGNYKKSHASSSDRDEYIRFLSKNLYDVLMLKKNVKDDILRKYHFSSKGVGEDLYYLTESYYRKKGAFKGKHSISDFITEKAKLLLESGENLKNRLKFEHMVPKNIYISKFTIAMKNGNLTEEFIFENLKKYYYVCTVTKDEDDELPTMKMNDTWDEENPFYRYEKAEIVFFPNNKSGV